jgi:hypothetical protein
VKGVGEAGCVGAPPGVMNAVLDRAAAARRCSTSTCRRRRIRVWQAIPAARNEPLELYHT